MKPLACILAATDPSAAARHAVARAVRNVACTRLVVGNPLATITAEVDALDASLVVLGARGDSFLHHALPGSTAARLLRKSARHPVLVVKQPPRDAYRSVLVADDFSPVSIQAIRVARQLAPQADMAPLHAFEPPYEGKLAFAGMDEQIVRQYVTTGGETRRKRQHVPAEAQCDVLVICDPRETMDESP